MQYAEESAMRENIENQANYAVNVAKLLIG